MTLPQDFWSASFFLIMACVFLWFAVDGLRTGTAIGKTLSANRKERPFLFFILEIFNFGLSVWLFYFSVMLLRQGM
jgi:hypothetical protein